MQFRARACTFSSDRCCIAKYMRVSAHRLAFWHGQLWVLFLLLEIRKGATLSSFGDIAPLNPTSVRGPRARRPH